MQNLTTLPEGELRDKYNTKERESAASKGEAMDGGSYPIKDKDDLEKAIRAVGRGGADHDSIRKHIISRAKALGLSALIPENWNSDGSLQQNAQETVTEHRRKKPRHRAIPLMPE